MHGLAVIYEFYTRKSRKIFFKNFPVWLNSYLSTVITFSFVAFSWIFFRSPRISDAFYIVKHLGNHWFEQFLAIIGNSHRERLELLYLGQPAGEFYIAMLSIFIMILVHRLTKDVSFDQWLIARSKPFRWSVYYSIIWVFIFFGIFNKSQFIYFQF